MHPGSPDSGVTHHKRRQMTESTTESAHSNVVWIEEGARKAPPADQNEVTIGEMAREFGVTLRALRFYESKGFIAPRREKSLRLYNRHDRARVAAILGGKKLGFTLAEIRTMLAGMDGDSDGLKVTKEKCLEQIHMLEKQQRHLEEALAELRRMHAGLSGEVFRGGWNVAGATRAGSI
jgi:DNA-binding transcriptional MerR regulator